MGQDQNRNNQRPGQPGQQQDQNRKDQRPGQPGQGQNQKRPQDNNKKY